jgi:hypothetical protein
MNGLLNDTELGVSVVFLPHQPLDKCKNIQYNCSVN